MLRRGRSPLPARVGPLLQASHRAGQCRGGSSTRSYTTSAPAVAPDRRRQPQAPPHAAGAAVATRCGQAGNRGGMLSARQRREGRKVGLFQGLTTMPTSILLRAGEACLLQRMSLFLAQSADIGVSAFATLL